MSMFFDIETESCFEGGVSAFGLHSNCLKSAIHCLVTQGPEALCITFSADLAYNSRRRIWSGSINDQWRITFNWSDGGAENVRIEDYHRG